MPDPGEPFTTHTHRQPTRWNMGSRGLPAVAAAAPFAAPDDAGRRRARATIDAGLPSVRAGLERVDAKANPLLAFAGVLLGAGLTVLGTGKLTGPAVIAGWVVVLLIGAAVVLLAAAVRPQLGGDFGFCRWARAAGGRELLDELTADTATDPLLDDTAELHWLSRALRTKYSQVRYAVHLTVAGLATAALAAALTLWTR
jgi:hypothetical protein